MLDLVKLSIHQDPATGVLCERFAGIDNGHQVASVFQQSPRLWCQKCGWGDLVLILRVVEVSLSDAAALGAPGTPGKEDDYIEAVARDYGRELDAKEAQGWR